MPSADDDTSKTTCLALISTTHKYTLQGLKNT